MLGHGKLVLIGEPVVLETGQAPQPASGSWMKRGAKESLGYGIALSHSTQKLTRTPSMLDHTRVFHLLCLFTYHSCPPPTSTSISRLNSTHFISPINQTMSQ